MPEPLIELLWSDSEHRIYYICQGSHTTFRDFADNLRASGPVASVLRRLPHLEARKDAPPEWKRLIALMMRAAKHGLETVCRNPKRTKCFVPPVAHTRNERMEVCEFKTQPYRVLFFREGTHRREPRTNLIVTHVFKKKGDETPPEELARFADIRAEYYKWRARLGATDAVDALSRFDP